MFSGARPSHWLWGPDAVSAYQHHLVTDYILGPGSKCAAFNQIYQNGVPLEYLFIPVRRMAVPGIALVYRPLPQHFKIPTCP